MPATRERASVERTSLANGLRVVVYPDPSVPLVGVAVVYNVGFRSEPEGRTGFAHLFEHMMFQGSAHVGKVEHIRLVESAGGAMNGHTLPDLTAYYEALPASGLELALFLEADRMARLAVSEENLRNQVDVVKEEIRVNVMNRPYGGFPWIPLPALAFDSYPNAHNGYGDFSHLERASVEESKEFYATYYSPSNAVLAVVGACRPAQVVDLAERHFGPIRRRRAPKAGPWREPRLAADRHRVVRDPLIPQPALAIGYRTVDPVGELGRYLVYHV
ncbi:MAG: M16 family metallopeptidase, partial [Acidimicrobiales bacterium]